MEGIKSLIERAEKYLKSARILLQVGGSGELDYRWCLSRLLTVAIPSMSLHYQPVLAEETPKERLSPTSRSDQTLS